MTLRDLVVRGPRPPNAIPFATRRGRPPKKPPPPTMSYRTRNHSLEPQTIDNETWFYEDRKGLLIVHEFRTDAGLYVRTDQFVIPWRMVTAAVQRHALRPTSKK
jgi:hypothetical protein